MQSFLGRLQWFYMTRFVAISLILYGTLIEDDPGNRGTCITAAIGLLAAEPVGRREKSGEGASRKDDRS